ncbi:hypothetical protein KI387_043198, partial [Taxus chinensis]
MEMRTVLENPISSGECFQWGRRKLMRCGKPLLKQAETVSEKKSTIRVDRRLVRTDTEAFSQHEQRDQVKSGLDKNTALPCNNSFRSSSCPPERTTISQHPVNDMMCTRRGVNTDEMKTVQGNKPSNRETFIWPKVFLSLSVSEKEEDFLAIKGSKLPLRPKKRLKSIQKAIQNVSPGGWLSDILQGRYEVREKKCIKK